MPYSHQTRSCSASAAPARWAVLLLTLGCVACRPRVAPDVTRNSEVGEGRTQESEPRLGVEEPTSAGSRASSDLGSPPRPADVESGRLCRRLESDRLDERVAASHQLLDRYVGSVTGGTEEQMGAASAYCREHHASEAAAGGCTVQNDTTEPLEFVASALDDAPLGTRAPGATIALGGHFAARQGSREARGFCAEGQALRVVRRGARLAVVDAP